jgi:hypothetical protein
VNASFWHSKLIVQYDYLFLVNARLIAVSAPLCAWHNRGIDMKIMGKVAVAAALVSSAAMAVPATAATVVVNGSLTATDPVFNSPSEGNPPTSVDVGAYTYDAYRFTVNTAGTYAISAASTAFDTYLGLYQGAFNPQQPLANALQYDDDSGSGTGSLISRNLSSGIQYFALVTSFAPSSRGNYSLSIAGPGTATISAAGAVPETATWAMMILGMGAVGFAMRRPAVKKTFSYA